MASYKDYMLFDKLPHTWCAGCGDGIVLQSIAAVFADMELFAGGYPEKTERIAEYLSSPACIYADFCKVGTQEQGKYCNHGVITKSLTGVG